MNALEVRGLGKRFGPKPVIQDLTFQVPENTVFGFLGENGAGKTTTMKIALGLLERDRGEILIHGEPVTYGRTSPMAGYLPDVPAFYGYMRAEEYLRLCGEITGMGRSEIAARSAELLDLVGLGGVKTKISGYSRGMKQRLGIAQALLNSPRLLICDEPTSALDPMGRVEILDILNRLRGRMTVVFSTHILSDVERICDRVALLHGGKIALEGTLAEIKAGRSGDRLDVEFAGEGDLIRLLSALERSPHLRACTREGNRATLVTENLPALQAGVIDLLAGEKLLPTRLEVREPSLESLFMEVVS